MLSAFRESALPISTIISVLIKRLPPPPLRADSNLSKFVSKKPIYALTNWVCLD
jgi:hypothetical protein